MMHLRANAFSRWFDYIAMGMLCAFGAFFLILGMFGPIPMKEPDEKMPMQVFVLFWNVFVYWIAYKHLKIPIEIFVNDTGNVVLRSLVGSLVLSPSQITKLANDSDEGWTLYHLQGELDLRYFRRKDMKKLYKWVVLANPNVQVPDEFR